MRTLEQISAHLQNVVFILSKVVWDVTSMDFTTLPQRRGDQNNVHDRIGYKYQHLKIYFEFPRLELDPPIRPAGS